MKWWDLDQVLAIEQEAFGPTAWSAESFWGELARPDRYYVVAQGGDEVFGYGGLWLVPPDADVQTLAVSAAARGQGLGRQLLDHLVDEAKARGCRRLHLEVRADNAEAIRLYESAGFGLVRRRPRYYPDFSDALVMG
ncbi:MAG TPA: ribosomal protein S18-alanine N-acetyltransferase, partial [Actinomycetota bacterium]|nr:ribosomal protein S18-alanine N-acetyltransferase [Actinomycetota bacterium]